MSRFQRVMERNPLLIAIGAIGIFLLVIWWLSKPIRLIYDSSAPTIEQETREDWNPNR